MADFFDREEYEDEEFTGMDFSDESIRDVSFFNCIFERCTFQYADLSHSSFDNCTFTHCNVSLTKLEGTHVFDVRFKGCKLMGTNWSSVRGLFKADFNDCILDNAVFSDINLQYFSFAGCSFNGASFVDSNLAHAVFDDCDLNGALFDGSNLTLADFSTAYGYRIDVSKNTSNKPSSHSLKLYLFFTTLILNLCNVSPFCISRPKKV
ncbi:pentapeptide repeat-containing protein [Halodesulfovibrio sp.]|uniref:pentapeptide repeat-containing protein n=1 Tax=Halodesulfovibrio sp. TaxID=1912772 RepID=UPI0025B97AD7|nr:pentapeptide repeat-containing protein [Halodesulfovibrio sp.]